MSAVRMCDVCGVIFREGADGSTVMTGTRMERDERGRQTTIQESQDRCPDCSGARTVAPRLALGATAKSADETHIANVVADSTPRPRTRVIDTGDDSDNPPLSRY